MPAHSELSNGPWRRRGFHHLMSGYLPLSYANAKGEVSMAASSLPDHPEQKHRRPPSQAHRTGSWRRNGQGGRTARAIPTSFRVSTSHSPSPQRDPADPWVALARSSQRERIEIGAASHCSLRTEQSPRRPMATGSHTPEQLPTATKPPVLSDHPRNPEPLLTQN